MVCEDISSGVYLDHQKIVTSPDGPWGKARRCPPRCGPGSWPRSPPGGGYSADGDYSPASWLIHQTRVTKGAARGHVAWARRAGRHPRVVAALAEGTLVTESVARIICGWTDKLPADCQDAADEILVGVALAGGRQEDLAVLAAEIYARSLPAGDDNPEPARTAGHRSQPPRPRSPGRVPRSPASPASPVRPLRPATQARRASPARPRT